MDELMELFDNFIGDALQLEKAMEEEFKVSYSYGSIVVFPAM